MTFREFIAARIREEIDSSDSQRRTQAKAMAGVIVANPEHLTRQAETKLRQYATRFDGHPDYDEAWRP